MVFNSSMNGLVLKQATHFILKFLRVSILGSFHIVMLQINADGHIGEDEEEHSAQLMMEMN